MLALPVVADELPVLHITPYQHEYDIADYSQYRVDKSGTLTITQLLDKSGEGKWKPVAGTGWSFGLSHSTYWFRFNLINNNLTDADNFLEIGYPLLDHIELYVVHQGQVIHKTAAGDALPFSARPYAFRNFLFKPPMPHGQPRSIYIRVKSEGSILVPVRLWHEHDFYSHEPRALTLQGLYFGVLLTVVLYNFLLFWFTRERSFLHFTLYVASIGLFQVALLGLGYQYLWPNSPLFQHYSIPLFMSVALFSALRFVNYFLPLRQYCPVGGPLLRTATLLTFLLLLALPYIPYEMAVKLGLLLTLLSAAVLIPTSFLVWWRARGETVYFFFAWLVFLIAIIISSSDKLGIGGLGTITDYAIQLGVLIQVITFTLALAQRMEREKQQRIAAQQQTKQELEQMVHERTAALEEANRQLDAMSHTDGLTGLRNRRMFDEELERQIKAAARNHTTLSLAMLDIDHFKKLNDAYGHQVGDDFLRLIAAEISAEVKRPMDSACRYGGEEFALILPDTPLEGAQQIAECIRSAVESLHHRVGDERVPVTISIGTVTLSPGPDDTSENLILLADKALYQAKGLGRNRVISC
jgi:diguanylate cyclase